MPRRYVQELKDGDMVDEVFLVTEKQLRANRNAALYLSVDLRDKTGVINGRMWNVTEETVGHVQSGGYARVRGKVQLFQGTLQLILTSVGVVHADALDPTEFEPQPTHDAAEMLRRLRAILTGLTHPELRELMACFLGDEEIMEQLSQAPAGVKAHHAYHGGLLEHVLTLLELANRVCDTYPDLPRDLLLCGVFLHDLGKVQELGYTGGFVYTDPGQLLGHLVMGVELLSNKIREWEQRANADFPEELAWRLKHMILSHHGSYEFGSPRLPMTPEAIALHHIDILDAKIHEFTRALADDPQGESHWTLFHPRLDRKLFKGKRPQ